MGRGQLLGSSERSQVIKQLGKNIPIATIAKKLGRDIRTVKKFVEEPAKVYTRPKGLYKVRIKFHSCDWGLHSTYTLANSFNVKVKVQ